MSVEEHREASPDRVVCAVLTVSDTRTLETDTGGQAIVARLQAAGHEVVDRRLTRDDPTAVRATLHAFLGRREVQAIITTGGTGIARRDSTYEAIAELFEKELVGFGELFRRLSYDEIGAPAMLSRATAGVVANRIVFMLPGSEDAVRLAMGELIIPELGHIVRELTK
jgi:molybdenum cofactor biosynthesis protein B